MKKWLFRALGKSGPPAVAVFLSGDQERSRSMALQMRELVPDHPHIIIGPAPVDRSLYTYAEEIVEADPSRLIPCWLELRRRLRRRRIALAPFVWSDGTRLRWAPWLLAPRKLLAFNADLERHHLRLSCPIASWRFLRGQRVGDIFRPTFLAEVRKLPGLAGFPFLLACWAAARMRRRAAATPAAARSARPGIAAVSDAEFRAQPDETVIHAPFDRVLVRRDAGREHPELADALDAPGVWLAYAGGKTSLAGGVPVAGEAMEGEKGTWALCGQPAAFLFRRDVYLELGGWDRHSGLCGLSLRGWQRGFRTVFAGAGEGEPPAIHPERLAFGDVFDFVTAARILREWSWQWRRWRGALKALGVVSAAQPPGPVHRDFLPLLDPGVHLFRGRPQGDRRRVAVVSPYLPFPLSHGGAIRIFNLLRRAASDTDIHLFAFAEKETGRDVEPLLEFCAQVVLVRTPRWEPRSLLPRGVAKFQSEAMQAAVATVVGDHRVPLVQVEYTQLAHFEHLLRTLPVKTLLVEHDVTFDLHRQLRRQARGWRKLAAGLEEAGWRRYELGHARRFDRVIAMSGDDKQRLARAGLRAERLRVVENGVDLERFRPAEPAPGQELLYIGSFRHFPNIMGFRFLLERIWPVLHAACPSLKLTVVAGGDHRYYWRRHTGGDLPALPPGIEMLDFVEDVRPLYRRATVVVAPLVVSAGTNIKVLEALASQRPLVSTTVGAAGLGLTSGDNAILADEAGGFAAAVLGLLWNEQAREAMAASGRAFVEANYGWETLAGKLAAVWDELDRSATRPAAPAPKSGVRSRG